jgi:sorbitol-specific phosphotransferase system component IIC
MSNTVSEVAVVDITQGLSGTLGARTPIQMFADASNIALGFLGIAAVLGMMIIWIYGFIDVIRRNDLKEHKLLWILLMLFAGSIGTLMYGFMEERKKLAYYTIAAYVAFPVLLVLFAVVAFLRTSIG